MKTVKQSNKKSWKGLVSKGKSSVLLSLMSIFSALCRDTAKNLDEKSLYFVNHVKIKKSCNGYINHLAEKKQGFTLLSKIVVVCAT